MRNKEAAVRLKFFPLYFSCRTVKVRFRPLKAHLMLLRDQ